MKFSRASPTDLFFICLFFILIFVCYLSYERINGLVKASSLVNRTNTVKLKLEQTLSYLKDAETGQRGYLLTKDSSFLKPYYGAVAKAEKTISEIDSLTVDNPQQQQNIDLLQILSKDRYNILTLLIKSSSDSLESATSIKANLFKGKMKMDGIRNLVASMITLEDEVLQKRIHEQNHYAYVTPISLFLLSFFTLIIIIISFFKIKNDLFEQRKIKAELLIQNETFKQAEENSGQGSFLWNLQSDVVSYSDNLFRILGCEPGEFIPSLKEFLKYVHPEDRDYVLNAAREAFRAKEITVSTHRIISKDGKLKYIKSSGKVINSGKEQMMIGTQHDITTDTLLNKNLKELNDELIQKNLRLKHNNDELASFTYIASHDLQEPLRKIRTFSNLMIEKEQLSDTGKYYFSRINAAAAHMQDLIDALLSYSRTNTTEISYEQTDLNSLLEEAKYNLQDAIKEKSVIIESSFLPTLNIISLQFYQILLNLISNAIKYSKQDVPPHIKIYACTIPGNEISHPAADTKSQYWKISIADNGIGFDQQYEHKIFELFQRLHRKTEYSGTGIGLAICKKIIERHNGFITATGIRDIGATFNIFIPVN